MKPEFSIPNTSQEKIPQPVDSVERVYDINKKAASVEKLNNKVETASLVSELDISTAFPAPSIQQTQDPILIKDDAIVKPVNVNPVQAAHNDVIEQEWVDRAKKIISSTRNDPHEQEKAISNLQIDYIKKRYGGDVGAAN